ncbi:disease resistance protein RPP4-like isoform X3 [Miscanthus floridulus]|uniref:disease resistance protein RPP4-like isoform X3 n=1 Tax=Miscanthus floridulus TaxID=154761 RepID=UPI003458E3E2
MLCLQLDLRFTWHLQRSADLTGAADATMEVAVSAARWVVGKALAPVTHGVLEAWAASAGLGPNVAALKAELLYARALLDNAHEREIRSPALKEMLHKLRQSAYDADDVLDELEYFRMQDELDGTHDAADVHAGGGCVHGLALNARHTARAVAAKLKPSSTSRGTIRGATSTARSSTTAQAVGDDCAGYQFPVEFLEIRQYGGSGEQLTRLLSCSPNLRYLGLENCEKLTGLGVANHQSTEAQAQFAQQQGTRGEEEVASAAALLLLPPQLQRLWISGCPKLVLCPDSIDGDTEAGGRGGLQGLPLQWLQISGCPRFLSLSSSSSSTPCFPFPASLEDLTLRGVEGMETLLPLSNLTSLTELSIYGFEDLRRGEGLRHLALGRLTKLSVFRTPNFFVVPEPSLPHELEFPPSSPKLQKLKVVVDDVAGLLAAPICAMLSCSLTELEFWGNKEVELERFTKHQEEAFQLLTSLETISFWECNKLQCLPAGLHRLPNLKILELLNCAAMQSLPKDGLPSSLQELRIQVCPVIRSMPKECIPSSLQKLTINGCPAIRSLPNVDDLPSSVQQLDVRWSGSEELRRWCRKLIGTIPIVSA